MTHALARTFGCAMVFWLCSTAVLAAPADELFAQGVRAFQAGDYPGAHASFEQARESGLDTPALHYNLGATLYKLGRYAEARQAFEACARDPAWAALSHYNMGLAAFQQGQSATAAEHFDLAVRYTDDYKLAALAQTMLARVDPLAYWRPRGTLALNLGHDSNVLLTDQAGVAAATGRSDGYTEFLAATTARFGNAAQAPRWEASLYDLRYFDFSDYNISALQLGLGVPWNTGAWRSEAGGQWQYLFRDGRDYVRITALQARTVRDLAGQRTLRFDFRHEWIDPIDNGYRFLDGTRALFGASASEPAGYGWIYYGAVFEHNDRADLATGGEFFSYSPARAGLWASASWPLAARWQLEPSVRYRYGQYADADRRASGVTQTRTDHDWQVGLRVRYRLTMTWQLTGEYIYSENRSNFDEFSYTRHQLQIGVRRPL